MLRRVLRATRVGFAVCVVGLATPAAAEDIALSLVHTTGRIDIPASAVSRIEVAPSYVATDRRSGKRMRSRTYSVYVCLLEDVRERICDLTRRIVGEPVEIVSGCEVLTEPVVREPICTAPCLSIPAGNMAEAEVFAGKLGLHPKPSCAPGNIGSRVPRVRTVMPDFRRVTR